MTLKEMPKVGDKIRYIGGGFNNYVTIGKVYEISENGQHNAYFTDDDRDTESQSVIYSKHFDKFELVTVQIEEPPVEASQSVIDLLANSSRRLYEVEEALKPSEPAGVAAQDETVDNVNSPQHYRHGRFETIELIEDITKKYDDGFVAYCVGNAVKYVDRAPFKHSNPSEDLRKASWYLTRAAEHTDAQ